MHSQLLTEINAQPQAIAHALTQYAHITAIAHQIQSYQPRFVLIAARGTSDNAARYAQYLFGTMLGWPVALATPAVGTLYNANINLSQALVIGISQSGRSPDICDVVQRAHDQGALTLAITNQATSPLATAAAHHIDIMAGPELSVAATKSYTNQLAIIALLSAALSNDDTLLAALHTVPSAMQQVLDIADTTMSQAATLLASAPAALSVGRGYQYATAFEASLKIKELSGLPVEPYSVADVLHGPVTIVENGFPVLVSGDTGATATDITQLLQRLHSQGATLIVASNHPDHLGYAHVALTTPAGDERLTPLVTIVAWQRLAYATAWARGRNPDAPLGLNKITETR